MNWQAISFDWNQVRAFLAVVDEGSFSAAARALRTTQPTLSRQIAALEESLGVTLFQRSNRAPRLTSAGTRLVDHVRAMADAAARLSLTATGQHDAIDGVVSITATSFMAARYLPGVVAEVHERAPGIEIEIIASNDVRDLTRREADIALRHGRPVQPDLVAKLIDDSPARLYASKDWIARHGAPQSLETLAGFSFIGFDASAERVAATLAERGLKLRPEDIRYRADSGEVILQMMRQGLGMSVMSETIAREFDELVPILPDDFCVMVPTWLVTHAELHSSGRIRLVFDLIAEAFARENRNGRP